MFSSTQANANGRAGNGLNRDRTALVVDDDPRTLARIRSWFEAAGFRVICTETCDTSLTAAHRMSIDIAVIDYRLRGGDGLSLAGRLHGQHKIPFILVSGFLNTAITVDAMRKGASDVFDKPLSRERLLRAVNLCVPLDDVGIPDLAHPVIDHSGHSNGVHDSPSQRLARLVLKACEATRDPKTVSVFAKSAVVSPAVFRATCKLCGLKAKDVCNLGRLLRAVSLACRDNSRVGAYLSVADERTARHLMRRSGLNASAERVELRQFFLHQQFVPIEVDFVQELGHLAANSSLFLASD
jgi:DNA-binding response OmpR family regulator